MGHPLDHRHANKRAHWQPRTNATDATMGSHVQSRTHVGQANRENITKKSLDICTYNPQSISDLKQEDLDVMLVELENMRWDVLGISASQIKESSIEVLPSCNHLLFNSGNETSRSNGVGFLVNKVISSSVCDYLGISDRLATLTLQAKENKIVFIQVYFPTNSHSDDEVDKLYDEIQGIIDKVPKRDHLFIMGDFNARVGNLHSSYPHCVGKHTIGAWNDRGVRLANFCSSNNLYITNTFFEKRRLHTWNHPNGKNKGQIDFILSRQHFSHNVTDSSVLNSPSISDHRMVRTSIKVDTIWKKQKSNTKRYDVESLKNNIISDSFELELNNRFLPLMNSLIDDVDVFSQSFNSAILDTADKIIPPAKSPMPKWMSNSTVLAISNKKDVRRSHGDSSIQYKVAKAEVKKLVKKDKINKINDDLDGFSDLPSDKQFFLAMKKLKTNRKNISWAIKDKNGKLLTSKEEILERWATFYEELYEDNTTCHPIDIGPSVSPIPRIIKREIQAALKKLKSGKSPGIDKIYSEFLKAGGPILVNILEKFFNAILTSGVIPTNFKEAMIIVLFKKDDRSECKNYRPISLLSHVYKLFMTIIGDRIKDDLYSSFPSSQAAYQPGRSTTEQIFSLCQLIEKSIEFNEPIHLVFIDFTKAFDSIKLDKLWTILDKTTVINKNYINLLKSLYDNSCATIKTDLGVSRNISIEKGVKQGDMLSAILFCIVLASVILKTEEQCPYSGYSVGGQILSNLAYADDIALANRDIQSLQNFVNVLAANAKEIGLELNLKKTECMTTEKTQPQLNIKIYGKPIKQVSEFIYLGYKLSCTNNQEVAVRHRIGLGWAAFGKHEKILKSSRVPLHVKTKIYLSYILPVVLYGLDCVTWNKTLSSKIEVFQNHILRFLTGHRQSDKIRITTLREMTKTTALFDKIKSKTLKLFGHIKRSNTGLSKLCLEGLVPGKRSRGKPRLRWRDNVISWSPTDNWSTLNHLTQDRKTWRTISHVSSQSAAGGNSAP